MQVNESEISAVIQQKSEVLLNNINLPNALEGTDPGLSPGVSLDVPFLVCSLRSFEIIVNLH